MCGIIGYIGLKDAIPYLINGLKILEYRGYDSAGVAVINKGKALNCKTLGKIVKLENQLVRNKLTGSVGIGHTRWATHGEPSKINAHPHTDCNNKTWLVHNGIIENYRYLKKELAKKGHIFLSQTDSEVIAHLIEEYYEGDIVKAVTEASLDLAGAYALVVFHENEPNKLIAIRKSSPLVIGFGKNEKFIASDEKAFFNYAKEAVHLDDNELAVLRLNSHNVVNLLNNKINNKKKQLIKETNIISKGKYPHYMVKEIMYQPEAIESSLRGRIDLDNNRVILGGLDGINESLKNIDKVIITACGTAYYAGLVGSYWIEELAGIPARAEIASEFRYRNVNIDDKTLLIAISQSGETADTLAALEKANTSGAVTLGIVNNVGSAIARAAQAGIYNHIGPEIAVASTKAFISQLVILLLFSIRLAQIYEREVPSIKEILNEIVNLPYRVNSVFKSKEEINRISKKYLEVQSFSFIGRKYNYPIALEGALKLKEVSYIHAEGFPSGELKHGSIALIDEKFPTVAVVPNDSVYEKNISNIEEIKARKGRIIAIASDSDETIKNIADDIVFIPNIIEILTPILSVIPLQLLSYYIALYRSCNIDQPRNLAKSVTVE